MHFWELNPMRGNSAGKKKEVPDNKRKTEGIVKMT